ncbi:MAG: hypothetical protein Q9209_005904 [Squamulea sp. 1 TL-2023]
MKAPYVCVSCRYRVVQHARRTRKLSFVSLNQSSSQHESQIPDNGIPQSASWRHGNDVHRRAQQQGSNLAKGAPTIPVRTRSGTDSILEQLFISSQKVQRTPTVTRYSGIPIHQAGPVIESSDRREYHDIERISRQFYQNELSLQEVWRSCESLLSAETKDETTPIREDPALRGANEFFRDLLMAINREFFLSHANDGLPAPHQVIKLYAGRTMMRYWWNDVLWFQLAEILKLLQVIDTAGSAHNGPALKERLVQFMEETMNVWSEFSSRFGPPTSRSEAGQNGVTLSPTSNNAWFLALLPKHRRFRVYDRTLAACKLTHQILMELIDGRRIAVPMTHHGQAFVAFLDELVGGRNFSLPAASVSLRQEGVQMEIIDRWLQYPNGWGEKPIIYEKVLLPSEATSSSPQLPVAEPPLSTQDHRSPTYLKSEDTRLPKSAQPIEQSFKVDGAWDKTSIHRATTTIVKDLERAVQRFDVARVAGIWQEYQRTLAYQDIQRRSREQIFIHFLTSFFALSRQEQAVHVWNDMVQAGIVPNQRHWNAMLDGCSKARDITSLDEIWNRMLNTGIEPDLVSWTTYVSGLIICKKFQRGLQALNDLGTKWKQASKTAAAMAAPQANAAMESHLTLAKHDASKPSLAPIQAAVSALLRFGKEELCWPLLDWTRSFSMPLTIGFFNVILRHAVRHGNVRLINHTFSLMDSNYCSADEQTYTILLNGHMSNINSTFPSLSPQEQQLSVLRILDDMTAKNLSIDQRTYGTILYGLLNPKNENRNDQAARAVLDHMSKNGIKPSHYIYTILASHYFSLSPPDLQGAEHLWKRIRSERPILDRQFYEKMVEGYAGAKSVERMLYFLRRIPHEGKSPTWNCLLVVLNTLIEVGEWSLAKEFVKDVEDRRSGLRRFADEGWKGGRVEEEFWITVNSIKHNIEEQGWILSFTK